MAVARTNTVAGWSQVTPDLLALASSLILAWALHWEVRDLVWSLWLSSLLIGYTTILLCAFGPAFKVIRQERATESVLTAIVGGVFATAFFTVHFGGFHFVHSIFLNQFFPLTDTPTRGFPGSGLYIAVLASYWPFAIAAAISERRNLMQSLDKPTPFSAYINVVRMHLLIFFFAGAAAAKLDSFLVYAVVLCVYFFPFRTVFGEKPQRPRSSSTR